MIINYKLSIHCTDPQPPERGLNPKFGKLPLSGGWGVVTIEYNI